MHIKNYFALFLFCQAAQLPAQTKAATCLWNVQAYGFVARYHSAVDYQPGAGIGLAFGRSVWQDWLACNVGFEYTRATQALRLITGSREAHANLYQSFFAMRVQAPIKKQVVSIFASLLGGCSFFRPQTLIVDAGTLGKITLRPESETKIVFAWSSGLTFRIAGAASILFSVKRNFSRFADRRLDAAPTQSRWRSYWNYGLGLSLNW